FRTAPQLSFLAVGVLTWFGRFFLIPAQADPLKLLIARTRPWPQRMARRLGDAVWRMTVAGFLVWLITLPLALGRFHLFSPVAVGLNPLLWPVLVVALVSGFVVLASGWLLPPLADLAARLCNESLGLLNRLVQWTQQAPGSHAWTPGPEPWWLVGLYGGLAALCLFPSLRPPRRWAFALLAGWIGIGFGASSYSRSAAELRVTFISLGHGCGAVVELPGGETLLYDAGRLGSPEPAERAISSYLWSRGITRIDAVVLSHADADHYNAIPGLLDRFSIGRVLVSPFMFESPNESLRALQAAIEDRGVAIEEIWQNDRLRTHGNAALEVLHPPRQGVLGGDNANSLVLAIQYEGRRILLPGDLESPGLDDVMAEPPWNCDLLMAPHHGSRNSDPPGFSAWCTPEWVVISSGYRHDVAQVEEAFRDAGAQVVSTWREGAVQATVAHGRISVTAFRSNQDE
ncbi:MAG: ComEC/Rec2 family competence protein, partial [Planctomycetales bacterium]|nr:ComEC/Rec2 family competence protein [Planctomycetales bacterium]